MLTRRFPLCCSGAYLTISVSWKPWFLFQRSKGLAGNVLLSLALIHRTNADRYGAGDRGRPSVSVVLQRVSRLEMSVCDEAASDHLSPREKRDGPDHDLAAKAVSCAARATLFPKCLTVWCISADRRVESRAPTVRRTKFPGASGNQSHMTAGWEDFFSCSEG